MKSPRRTSMSARVAFPAMLIALLAGSAPAAPPAAIPARSGLDLARAAARTWADDAFLVYVENDEPLDAEGAAGRWGYLFYAPSRDAARVYSVRGQRIVVAAPFDVRLDAPPVAEGWIDSGQALAAAERAAGRAFRERHRGSVGSMLLMRGAFDEQDPDRTTWTLVYAAPDQPSLFVVVDAADGTVRRTWRG